jgi:hypothetical protein
MGLTASFRCESIEDGEGVVSCSNIVVFDGEPLDGVRFFILDYGVPSIEEFNYISVFSALCDEGCEDSVFNWLLKSKLPEWMDWRFFFLTSFHGAVTVCSVVQR